MDKTTLKYNLDIEEQSTWLFISSMPDIKKTFPFIQELGNFYCQKDYFTKRKNLESYYIAYTKSGSGILEYEEATYKVEPFQLLWIMRRIWIARINAAARLNGLSYSRLMHGLKLANIEINRKMLSEMAIHDEAGFAKVCEEAKAALN